MVPDLNSYPFERTRIRCGLRTSWWSSKTVYEQTARGTGTIRAGQRQCMSGAQFM